MEYSSTQVPCRSPRWTPFTHLQSVHEAEAKIAPTLMFGGKARASSILLQRNCALARHSACPTAVMATGAPSVTVYADARSDDARRQAVEQLSKTNISILRADKSATPVSFSFTEGLPSGVNAPQFNTKEYFRNLTSRELGTVVLSAALLPSTQTLLQQHASVLPDGVVCIADQQDAGKGRGGNQWTSPEGCLMFTLNKILRISGDKLPFLQYVVSLAIVQAVQQSAAPALQGKLLDIRIKWPNDIYGGGQKLGGILCHSSYRNQLFYLTVGCGINLTNAKPTTCIAELIAKEQHLQQHPATPSITREVLLAAILSRLEEMLDTLCSSGFGPLLQAYLSTWLHSGQQVTLVEGEHQATSRVQLTVQGITNSGYLLATDAAGEAFELHPDGNSFDFFQGLVRRKLPA